MPKCSQCNDSAMYEVQGHNLCLHCYSKMAQIALQQQAEAARMINYLSDRIDETIGIRSTARIAVPQPIINQGTHNYIQVDRSVVGAINAGTIQNLNQTMQDIDNNVNPGLAKMLTIFTNALLQSQEIKGDAKQELLEQVAFLAEQINTPPQSRKKTLIKQAFSTIKESITTVASLVKLWEGLESVVKGYLLK